MMDNTPLAPGSLNFGKALVVAFEMPAGFPSKAQHWLRLTTVEEVLEQIFLLEVATFLRLEKSRELTPLQKENKSLEYLVGLEDHRLTRAFVFKQIV